MWPFKKKRKRLSLLEAAVVADDELRKEKAKRLAKKEAKEYNEACKSLRLFGYALIFHSRNATLLEDLGFDVTRVSYTHSGGWRYRVAVGHAARKLVEDARCPEK